MSFSNVIQYMYKQISYIIVYYYFFSSFFFLRKKYLLLSCATSVRPSVRPSVCPSVEIISFRGISKSNRPIDLKMSMNVRKGVVHVRNARFFKILIASYQIMQFANFCK